MENTKLFTLGEPKNGEVVSELIGKQAMDLLEQLVKGQDKNPEDPEDPVVKQVPRPDEWNPCQHVYLFFPDGKVLRSVQQPMVPPSTPVSEEKTPSSEGVVVEDPADEDDLYA
jgi:hypothetical protein